MKPCTTYTYQCQRVPYTTYRPVYRQESYKVPVTTITNDCSTGTCAPCNTCDTGCSTCATGVASPAPQNFAPQTSPTPAPISNTYYEQVPASTSTGGNYNSTVPANSAPSLLEGVSSPQALQRPILDQFGNQNRSNYQTSSPKPVAEPWSNAPATINLDDKTAQSPVRKQWSYSPIRMASYSKPSNIRSLAPLPSAKPQTDWVKPQTDWVKPREAANELNGWVEVN
jgi:hypothetical protein